MEKNLIDSCLLIDYTRGKKTAVDYIDGIGKEGFCVNSIIIMELYQGDKDRDDLRKIKQAIQQIINLPIDQTILDLATDLLEYYKLSHHPKMPDMIIAATALTYNIEIKTYNLKDFRYIPNIKVSDDLKVS
jgi:tRNA(fMet)-specific endonuclease VapC